MYHRNQELHECWEKDAWYGISDSLDISGSLLYNPDDEAMETLAALKPEWFAYDKPFLLSTDRTILYGFAISSDTVLEIPKTVTVYDNLFIHEEDYGYKTILINESLEEIVNLQNAFGFYVENYVVDERNSDFASESGILYDDIPYWCGDVNLILFPSGRGISMQDSYMQFNPDCRLNIGQYAFYMKGFIKALVLTPKTRINDKSFFIKGNGKGKIFADPANGTVLFRSMKKGQIEGIDIECYWKWG